jgi:hypothetical protein
MATIGYAALPLLVFTAAMVLFLRMMHDIGTRTQSMRGDAVRPRSGQVRRPATGSTVSRFKA